MGTAAIHGSFESLGDLLDSLGGIGESCYGEGEVNAVVDTGMVDAVGMAVAMAVASTPKTPQVGIEASEKKMMAFWTFVIVVRKLRVWCMGYLGCRS